MAKEKRKKFLPESKAPAKIVEIVGEKKPIPVVGGDTMRELIEKAGVGCSLDFLVKVGPMSEFGDHLLIGYFQVTSFMEFKKLGTTYKTEDPEQFKAWLTMKEFGGVKI